MTMEAKAVGRSGRGPSFGRIRARCGRRQWVQTIQTKAGRPARQPDQVSAPRFFGSTSPLLVGGDHRHNLAGRYDLHALTPFHLFADRGE